MGETSFRYEGVPISLRTFGPLDHISRIIETNESFYEIDVLKRSAEIYIPGTTIVDAGANIGNHTIFYAKVVGARVRAFEPLPEAFSLLEDNVKINGVGDRVEALQIAVGRTSSRGILHRGPSGNLGQTTIGLEETGDVQIVPIDELGITEPISILKIDVEGSEIDVVAGAEKTILRHKPSIFVEANDEQTFWPLLAHMHELGFGVVGRFGWTPTYLFEPYDRRDRIANLLSMKLGRGSIAGPGK